MISSLFSLLSLLLISQSALRTSHFELCIRTSTPLPTAATLCGTILGPNYCLLRPSHLDCECLFLLDSLCALPFSLPGPRCCCFGTCCCFCLLCCCFSRCFRCTSCLLSLFFFFVLSYTALTSDCRAAASAAAAAARHAGCFCSFFLSYTTLTFLPPTFSLASGRSPQTSRICNALVSTLLHLFCSMAAPRSSSRRGFLI